MQNIIPLFSHPVIKKLDHELSGVFHSVPHLPKKAIEVLVKISPYLVLVSGLFFVTGGLRSIFGMRDLHRFLGFWGGVSPVYFYVIGLLEILAGAISILSYQPLRDRQIDGWFMLLCLTLLQLIMNLVSVFFFSGGLFGLLISLLISLYILYEVKSEYIAVKTAKVIEKTASTKVSKDSKSKKK